MTKAFVAWKNISSTETAYKTHSVEISGFVVLIAKTLLNF